MSAQGSSPPSQVILGCSRCGASLPDGARFCLKCGKPVSVVAEDSDHVEVLPPAAPPRRRKSRRRLTLLLLLLLFVTALAWVATSDSSAAQDIQEMVGWKHDEIVLDSQFSVAAHSFRYYKFSLPEGSVNVAVVGEFTSAADVPEAKGKSKAAAPETDNQIQVTVLSDAAFTIWQNGYGATSLYDSGNVAHGTVQADIPPGAGIYYLVFNNRFAPKTAKSVRATVLLRYKSWLPEWYRRMKERVLDWAGLD